ncbi:MAG: RDD family protein [Cellvibrionaceae bacterium]
MDPSIYQTPEADLTPADDNISDAPLASRWSRLGASLLDTIILFAILFPLLFLIGWFSMFENGNEPPLLHSIILGFVGIIIFFAVNYRFLSTNGQTIGKKALNIKIVATDGSKAILGDHIIKRYLVYFIPNHIPVIGSFLSMANVLFIFRKNKQCLHDDIAKTKVIKNQ